MAALDFPNSPTVGQQYAASNGALYSWDGAVWISQAQGQAVFIGVNPPPNPPTGNLWWRSDPDQNLYVYYDDGNSKQYVNAVPSVSKPTGPASGDLTGNYPGPAIAASAVTWPKLSLQTYLSASRASSNFSVPSGAVTSVPFDTINQNQGGMAPAPPTSTFTIQQSGFYLITAMCVWANTAAGSLRRMVVTLANSVYVIFIDSPASTAVAAQTGAAAVYIAAGQTVVMQAYQDSGSAMNLVITGGTPAALLGIARIA